MRKTISLVLAVLMMLVLLPAVKLSPAVAEDTVTYTKVTKMSDITDGKYLVVVDSKKLDGAYYTFNGTSSGSFNKVDVDIADNTITGDYAANEIEIAVVEGGYTLKNSAGKYLGAGNGSNTVVFSDDALVNGIAINSSNTFSISMTTDAARELKLNNSNDQPYFRYYKVSTTNSNYYLPALYKKVEGTTPQPTETATPEPTNTPEPTTPPAPEGLTAVLMTELPANGDKIVIHNTANNMALGEGEKVSTYYNEGVAITPDANGILSNVPETIVWDVTVTEDGYYRFSQEKGVLAAGSYSSTPYNEVNKDWTIETLGEGYMIGNVGREGYYLEWYSSRNYFSIYNRNIDTTPDLFTFRFFKVSDEVPPTPTTGDTIVLFTNDVHCGIRDGWGYAGVADLKKTLEAEGNEVILVDAGDHSQGGPIGSLTQGTAIIDIMNAVGYDLAIPGNHEFDYGMTQFLNVLAVRANYPYVSANFMDLTTNTPVFDAYKIIEANGKKIAFVGLSTPESITKSTPAYFMNEERTEYIYGFCQDDTGAGVYTAAQNAIDAAKAEGADYVIIVGHMGIDEQSQPWTAPEVIANTTGVNAFIDGHSHSVINKTVKDKNGNDVLHGQTGTKLANVGKLTIKADGTMTIEILPASEKVKDDPEVDAVIAAIEAEFNELLNSVVAHTDHVLTIKNPDTGARAVRSAETNLGDLCADAYRYMFDADVAFVNGGGVRADIAEGDITFQQVINVHPFGNTAVLAEVTGQQILDALEMGARVCPSENGGFLQVAGLTYEIHTYLDANVVIDDAKVWQGPAVVGGEYRVKNVKILNKTTGEYEPLDLAKKYTLASHNYMLKDMGDGFAMFGSNITILEDSGKLDNQVLIDYIQSMPEVDGKHVVTGYTDPKGEGRIKIVTEAEPTGDTIVLFTNDVHCGIRDGWGYAGVADLKKTLEKHGNEVILVDAGDHSQGGPIGSLTQGTAIIDIMNAVGYDLAIPGNHEFDYGMTQFLNVLAVRANYPYVSANFMDLTTNTPVFDAYKIIEANGKKIAFVGLSTPESITKSTPAYFMNEERTEYIYGFCQDDTGAGVYTAAQNAIDAAKAEGADYVIIVGHMGIDEQSQPWTAPEVIANTTGVNAFIDGHSHSVINKTVKDKNGNDVLHGQTGTKLANVGKLTIKADGTMTIEILPASEKVKDDPEVDAVIAAIEAEFNELLNSVVAHTDHVLTIKNPDTGARAVRSAETNLGDLCADAYRYMFDADVAFVNGGGVRADIAEGDITFQQVINVHPFGNTAVLAEVTGQQILDALEMGARVCPSENGGFLQVAGLTYEIHTYLDANVVIDDAKVWQGPAVVGGEYRVKNVKILNKTTGEYEPLDLAKKYTLASHNYMLKDMGDGFAMFGSNITILEDSGKLDNQVLIDYIQSMPEVDGKHVVTGYTDPKGEGRIKIVTEQPTPVFYGEDVDANDVAEYVDGKTLYRYDVKVKDIDQKLDVTSLQVYLAFDNSALKFVEARSALEGSTGINEADGLISFAWATTGDGIKLADDTVIMSVYFELVNPVPDGTKIDIVFAEGANGAATGFSFVDGDTVSEAAAIETVNGSLTFAAPEAIQFVGAEVLATDVAVIEGDRKLYRYDVTIANVPEGGLMINSAQIFLAYDAKLLTFVKADGIVDWTVGEKTGKVLAVWADETEFMVKNGDVVLSVYFEADAEANGKTVDIAFTTNTLDTFSAASVVYGGTVVELEAETVDGSITFPEIIWGDANCDGKVTAADAAMILRALVDLAELTEQGALNADVNCDNEVTAEDAAIILRYIVKLIDKLPVED